MPTGTLTARKANDDPAGYRVIFDDGTGPLEVGSIAERERHVTPYDKYWTWGVDIMPLMVTAAGHPTAKWSRVRRRCRRLRSASKVGE